MFVIKKLNSTETALAIELIEMFGTDNETDSMASAEYVSAMLCRADFHVIAAFADNSLIGGLTAYEMKMFKGETTEMFLYEIEVRESYRRRGIGKKLIEALQKICAEKGIVQMFVGTEKDNLAARRLYLSTDGIADEDSIWFNYYFG